ncbi:MAG: aminomethyl-transferring glycine dehydrogenase subunit GcvPB [Candidatus Diapherotrites archaeon]|uniref:Probable glycine dehydrogenase (decarboxylating) subunit 2 n=1 Tax=Candidatus Iainarchaeum sp. TaxID=3101447 RepID=A0A8T4LCJ6_9ARCH|nr:aminomethyl-transferring glycine dehydrogenase subunit GcvPB [Candidatus Diapherotrites archaeon]
MSDVKLIYERSVPGRTSNHITLKVDVPLTEVKQAIPAKYLRKELGLPEVNEVDVIRHYIGLSKLNYGVDNGFYPLGSCTMKYNPKVNDAMAALPGHGLIHPMQPVEMSQGALQLMYELEKDLAEITGMARLTLQPAAGAHGELTGIMTAKKYFEHKGEGVQRNTVLEPDSSHGTNPASANMCGFKVVEVKSNKNGSVDLDDLRAKMSENVAVFMLTNPNTLGLFDPTIEEIAKIVHAKGGLMYCDGANLNANVGIVRPGDLGFDIIQLNLHKTFSTPHGGGGPGSGPVGVKSHLVPFLPKPSVEKVGEKYTLDYNKPHSIGRVKAFQGNYGILSRAYTYIKSLGREGLRKVGENAVLNANYMMARLRKHYHLAYDRVCQHEFVLSDEGMPNGVTTMDIAKRLLDYGFHSPTIYFPLIVHGAIMIEPTETESKQTLDAFIETMVRIHGEAQSNPGLVKGAPHTTFVKRLDAVKAAREPVLRWQPPGK